MKKFKFKINGNEYDVEILNIEDNIGKVEVNGTVYEVYIQKDEKISKTPKLVRSITTPNNVPQQFTNKPDIAKSINKIKAPLPGTILHILKKEGDEVKIGDTILIMEAMKMENEIRADIQGKIQKINVKENDSVLEGDILVEIGS